MKLLSLELPGVQVRKAGKVRTAVPSASNLREHHMARASRAKKQRSAAQLRLKALLGGKVLLVARLTRVAPRALDDDNLRGALKAYRDGVADALGLANDKPGWLQWEYAQERCPTGEPERVRLDVRVANDRFASPEVQRAWGVAVSKPPRVEPLYCANVRCLNEPLQGLDHCAKHAPAYTPPRTVRELCRAFGCPEHAMPNSPHCVYHSECGIP